MTPDEFLERFEELVSQTRNLQITLNQLKGRVLQRSPQELKPLMLALLNDEKIKAIRECRRLTGSDLKEAKKALDEVYTQRRIANLNELMTLVSTVLSADQRQIEVIVMRLTGASSNVVESAVEQAFASASLYDLSTRLLQGVIDRQMEDAEQVLADAEAAGFAGFES